MALHSKEEKESIAEANDDTKDEDESEKEDDSDLNVTMLLNVDMEVVNNVVDVADNLKIMPMELSSPPESKQKSSETSIISRENHESIPMDLCFPQPKQKSFESHMTSCPVCFELNNLIQKLPNCGKYNYLMSECQKKRSAGFGGRKCIQQ